jgi:hypothetical protein
MSDQQLVVDICFCLRVVVYVLFCLEHVLRIIMLPQASNSLSSRRNVTYIKT